MVNRSSSTARTTDAPFAWCATAPANTEHTQCCR
ncbi:E3 ubiquitin-protein ligase TRIM7 isoform X4 [Prionailurus iriomotensis]